MLFMSKTIKHTVILLLAAVIIFTGCKKTAIVTTTTDVVNIYDYLKQNPDRFSSLLKIVDKSGYGGFLNAYGSYTMFAPTNDAVNLFLTSINKTIDQITETEAKDIVKFHLLEDTLTTASFKDGKLPLVTMYGQYLVTSVVNNGGTSSFNINRQALVVTGNILTGNGFVHAIDHVLRPATKTIAQHITDNPDFSIFRQALVATGYYDSLNTINLTNPSRRWLTVLAETNQALLDSLISIPIPATRSIRSIACTFMSPIISCRMRNTSQISYRPVHMCRCSHWKYWHQNSMVKKC
jgi:uncharacterized surface protein with fasciclin (FAS1) repeats